MMYRALSALIFLMGATQANASEWWMVESGISYHFDRTKDLNEENWGLGLEWQKDRTWAVIAGVYRNSYYRDSVYVGAAYTPFQWKYAKAGVIAGLVSGYEAGPFMLAPTLMVEVKGYGMNLLVIPPISKDVEGVVGLQLKSRF